MVSYLLSSPFFRSTWTIVENAENADFWGFVDECRHEFFYMDSIREGLQRRKKCRNCAGSSAYQFVLQTFSLERIRSKQIFLDQVQLCTK